MTAEDCGEGDALDVTFEMPRGSLEGATCSATIGVPVLRHPGRDATVGLGGCARVCTSGAGRNGWWGGGGVSWRHARSEPSAAVLGPVWHASISQDSTRWMVACLMYYQELCRPPIRLLDCLCLFAALVSDISSFGDALPQHACRLPIQAP